MSVEHGDSSPSTSPKGLRTFTSQGGCVVVWLARFVLSNCPRAERWKTTFATIGTDRVDGPSDGHAKWSMPPMNHCARSSATPLSICTGLEVSATTSRFQLGPFELEPEMRERLSRDF